MLYESARGGFTIEVPSESWKIDDSDPNLLLMLSNDDEDAYIFVVSGEVPEEDVAGAVSEQEFTVRKEASQAVIEKQFDTFKVLGRQVVPIGGTGGEEVEFSGTKGEEDFKGKIVFMLHGRRILILSSSTTDKNYERLSGDMDRILRSFTFVKG